MMAASWFAAAYPAKKVRFLNRGVGGDRVKDMRARWQEDCLDLKPDWVSIMIGINDCWRRFDANDATSAWDFEAAYRDILVQVKQKTKARLIIMEPFLLHAREEQRQWRGDLDPKIEVARKLAEEFGAVVVPLDRLFSEACGAQPPAYWAGDGVHPSLPGHALIAQAWLKAIGAIR